MVLGDTSSNPVPPFKINSETNFLTESAVTDISGTLMKDKERKIR